MGGVTTTTTAAKRLRAAEDRLTRHLQKADELRKQRDKAVVAAVDAGLTRSEVAAMLGVTVGRVTHLIPPERRKPYRRKIEAPTQPVTAGGVTHREVSDEQHES